MHSHVTNGVFRIGVPLFESEHHCIATEHLHPPTTSPDIIYIPVYYTCNGYGMILESTVSSGTIHAGPKLSSSLRPYHS
jgi:hypothetical protein